MKSPGQDDLRRTSVSPLRVVNFKRKRNHNSLSLSLFSMPIHMTTKFTSFFSLKTQHNWIANFRKQDHAKYSCPNPEDKWKAIPHDIWRDDHQPSIGNGCNTIDNKFWHTHTHTKVEVFIWKIYVRERHIGVVGGKNGWTQMARGYASLDPFPSLLARFQDGKKQKQI